MKKIFGFSLVEIVVGLIIISVLLAAFAPIISKKLKNSSISVGLNSFGSGNNSGDGDTEDDNPCQGKQCSPGKYANKWDNCKCTPCTASFCKKCENNECSECTDGYELIDGECKGGTASCRESGGKPTQECCESVGAVYLPKETTGLATDLCMMKYNAFDGNISGVKPAENLVKVVDVKKPCTIKNCCWKATDSNKSSSSCTNGANGDSSYSGCTRTICQATAAEKICSNWSPAHYAPGAWRLPTLAELNALKGNISILSSNQGSAGLQLCDGSSSNGTDKCSEKSGACLVASENTSGDVDTCSPHRIWGVGNSFLDLSSGVASTGTESNAYMSPKSVRCVTSNVGSGRYYTHNVDYSIGEPASQEDCDKFNAFFVSAKYNGNPNGRNICVTKFNALDLNGPFNPVDSSIVKLGIKFVNNQTEYCKSKSCCWQGVTSDNYTNSTVYGGSSRTVCQATSAEILCNNWNPTGSLKGAWRLPYKEELNAIAQYIPYETAYSYFLNLYMNGDGLQLCDSSSSNGVDRCTEKGGACLVASENISGDVDTCSPHRIWGVGNSFLDLSSGVASIKTESDAYMSPKSVRCVTDAILKTSVADQTLEGITPEKAKEYQKICDKYNALFINKKFLGTGKHICMTKYNALDENGPMANYTDEQLMALNPSVKKVRKTSEYCDTKNCCWGEAVTSGNYTSNQNGDSTYSGGMRTVCQATAASSLCANWAPDSNSAGKWRLPKLLELQNIARNLNLETVYSSYWNKHRGKNGLQFCDSSSSNGLDRCSVKETGCLVAPENTSGDVDNCAPYRIWGTSNSFLNLSGGIASTETENGPYEYPKGVRCVLELD